MALRELIPWGWGRKGLAKHGEEEHPFYSLQRRMNRIFEDFFHGFEAAPFDERFRTFSPHVDVTENDKEIKVTAELPGMDDKDIDVSLTADTLTVKGEKKEEKEDKGKDYYRTERSYGSFRRTVQLPCEVDAEKVDAQFKKGVLTITLPKKEEAVKAQKKITVKSE